jgi:photosystem II stability/assembly factor-like uncharacterized protein
MRVLLLIGTRKGVFVAESDGGRAAWRLRGPLTSGTWAFNDLRFRPPSAGAPSGRLYAAGSSNWYGPAVWWSDDLGATWEHSSAGLTYGDAGPAVEDVWSLAFAPGGETVYAGVDPAGLFRSTDGRGTWEHLPALRAHPTSAGWQPTKAGLPLHAILCLPQGEARAATRPADRGGVPLGGAEVRPGDPGALWVAVGAGGVYRSEDGGDSWERLPDAGGPAVLGLALAPGGAAERLYQQSRHGVYRSDDGGASWEDVSAGLPCRHGFPVALHPRDRETAYVVPRDDAPGGGRLAVWRTRDAGGRWERLDRGLPAGPVHTRVLRRGLASDGLEPAGVYLATFSGRLFASPDEGETWRTVAPYLPPILSLTAATVDK